MDKFIKFIIQLGLGFVLGSGTGLGFGAIFLVSNCPRTFLL